MSKNNFNNGKNNGIFWQTDRYIVTKITVRNISIQDDAKMAQNCFERDSLWGANA